MIRWESGLIFPNARGFSDQVKELVESSAEPVDWVLYDAEATSDADFTGTATLLELIRFLDERGVTLVVAEPNGRVREELEVSRPASQRSDRSTSFPGSTRPRGHTSPPIRASTRPPGRRTPSTPAGSATRPGQPGLSGVAAAGGGVSRSATASSRPRDAAIPQPVDDPVSREDVQDGGLDPGQPQLGTVRLGQVVDPGDRVGSLGVDVVDALEDDDDQRERGTRVVRLLRIRSCRASASMKNSPASKLRTSTPG